jgi:hypothetical protein
MERGYGKMNTTFSDAEWRSAILRLLVAINAVEHSNLSRPQAAVQEKDLLKISDDLATRKYRPDEWFQPGAGVGTGQLRTSAPSLDPHAEYRLLKLNALDEPITRASMRFGGIAFEDPFYALLACFNLGMYGSLFFLPRVTSVDQAWSQRSAILDALVRGSYIPDRFFVKCTPAVPGGTGLPMEDLTVNGALLGKLRESGRGNVPDNKGIGKYALYDFVPEQ